jgi:hypothetical protein
MEQISEEPSVWVTTKDNQLINVTQRVAQQSNLLTVLQEKYAGTQTDPIPIPITTNALDFFCKAITISVQTVAKELTHKSYSQLMDITEELKALLFYAELMEQLLQVQELCNQFAISYLDQVPLKKAIYKKCLEKKHIKTTEKNNEETIFLACSHDGTYCAETVLCCRDNDTGHYEDTAYRFNLWDTHTHKLIKTYSFFKSRDCGPLAGPISFSPDNKHIIIDNMVYDVHQDTFANIPNESNYYYHPSFSIDGQCIITRNGRYNLNGTLIEQFKKSDEISHKISISSDGSQLLKNEKVFLNIKAPYNEIIIKEFTKNNVYMRNVIGFFIPHKKLFLLKINSAMLYLIDKDGKIITSKKDCVSNQCADKTGNYLVTISPTKNCQHNPHPMITFWNLSNSPSSISQIKVKTDLGRIPTIEFTKDQLLVTQSTTTKLWDMDGDEVLDLGCSNCHSCNSCTGSIITAHNMYTQLPSDTPHSHIPLPGRTTLWHWDINAPKAKHILSTITQSLTLSHVLLLNAHASHRKTKKRKNLDPDMPDGRALASFTKKYGKEYKFLTKNFKLNTKEIS